LDFGKYAASLGTENKTRIKIRQISANKQNQLLISEHTHKNNGAGYQQLDLHAVDVLRTLDVHRVCNAEYAVSYAGVYDREKPIRGCRKPYPKKIPTGLLLRMQLLSNFRVGQPVSVTDKPDSLWLFFQVFFTDVR